MSTHPRISNGFEWRLLPIPTSPLDARLFWPLLPNRGRSPPLEIGGGIYKRNGTRSLPPTRGRVPRSRSVAVLGRETSARPDTYLRRRQHRLGKPWGTA